jgi:Dyp-type peroxidase family
VNGEPLPGAREVNDGPAHVEVAPAEPVLDAEDIQGDILAGFRKDHETFAFFQIQDPAAFRERLAELIPHISTLREVAAFNELYRAVRRRRGHGHTGLAALWINIAFSASGLGKLTTPADVQLFVDESFRVGMAARASVLGDIPPTPNTEVTSDWRFGGKTTPVDGVLLLAGDDLPAVEQRARQLQDDWFGPGGPARLVWAETGHVRPDLPGHEHFGFRDGISQPAVRGRLANSSDSYLATRYISDKDQRALRFARPGERLIWPGEFLIGQPRQAIPPDDDLAPGPIVPPQPAWAANGSYLVIRRLNQDVAAFQMFARNGAAALAKEGLDIDADTFASLLVGRWPSGAPRIRTPDADNAELGQDDFAANDYGYVTPWGQDGALRSPTLELELPLPAHVARVDRHPPPQADDPGFRCPHLAHVRKVNPRDDPTDTGDVLRRRILRRGLPFGPPWSQATATQERGLMFACYQASIKDQFEFLMTNWVNKANTPRADPGGTDLLIGGKLLAERQLALARRGAPPVTLKASDLSDTPWVTTTGGGYFFAPSLTALSDTLSAPGNVR